MSKKGYILAAIIVLLLLAAAGLLLSRGSQPAVVQGSAATPAASLTARPETTPSSEPTASAALPSGPGTANPAEPSSSASPSVTDNPAASPSASAEQAEVRIPALEGQSVEEAVSEIRELGLIPYGLTIDETATGKQPGTVVSTIPTAFEKAPAGTQVTIRIAPGKKSATVRTVVGKSAAEAISALRRDGLEIRNVAPMLLKSVPAGAVTDTYPQAGKKAPQGVAVAINPGGSVAVTNVAGMSPELAAWVLLSQGLQPEFVDEAGKSPAAGSWAVQSTKQSTATPGGSVQVVVNVTTN